MVVNFVYQNPTIQTSALQWRIPYLLEASAVPLHVRSPFSLLGLAAWFVTGMLDVACGSLTWAAVGEMGFGLGCQQGVGNSH